jgi:hypothetical protein
VFPSETYFDFYVQHAEDVQEFFQAFYETYQNVEGKNKFFEVLLILRRSVITTERSLTLLLNMWNLQLVLQNQLKMQGVTFVQSPDHAQETVLSVYEDLSEDTLRPDIVNDMFKRLVELGNQKFQQ